MRELTSHSALLETASVYKRKINGVVKIVDVQPTVNASFTSATMTITFSNAQARKSERAPKSKRAPKNKRSAASSALTSLRSKLVCAFEKQLADNDAARKSMEIVFNGASMSLIARFLAHASVSFAPTPSDHAGKVFDLGDIVQLIESKKRLSVELERGTSTLFGRLCERSDTTFACVGVGLGKGDANAFTAAFGSLNCAESGVKAVDDAPRVAVHSASDARRHAERAARAQGSADADVGDEADATAVAR